MRHFVKIFLIVIGSSSIALAATTQAPQEGQGIPNYEHVQYWMRTLESNPLIIIRKQAARQLGAIQNNIAVVSLVKGLADVNDDVRIQSAYALGRIGDAGSLKPLYELIETSTNSQVKTAARNAIDKINAHEEFTRQRKQKLKDSESKSDGSN